MKATTDDQRDFIDVTQVEDLEGGRSWSAHEMESQVSIEEGRGITTKERSHVNKEWRWYLKMFHSYL